MLFDQTFEAYDLAVVGLLVLLEGVLSIDNALVLGLLAKRLPKHYQPRALTYGLVGAFVFRLLAIALAAYLLKWRIVKLVGGGYLVYVALNHFYVALKHFLAGSASKPSPHEEAEPAISPSTAGTAAAPVLDYAAPPETHVSAYTFWSTVGAIELTDIAFAIDSILAAIALVGSAPAGHTGFHPKLWVVLTGGFLGVILMRFAAVVFIKLLERFPRFETSAYLLVLVIGGKLLVDWGFNTPASPHRVDFHSPSDPAFWVFWGLMLVCFLTGFAPQRPQAAPEREQRP